MLSDFLTFNQFTLGFRDSSAGKESACNAGDLGSIPGLERSPGEGKGLENSMDYTVHGVAKSSTLLREFHFQWLLLRFTLGLLWYAQVWFCLYLFHSAFYLFLKKSHLQTERFTFIVHAVLCLVVQSYLILCDPMDYSLPGSSVHGILQARLLSSSRGSF